jgi:3alpha(or 20beta)-hydroxysteroid dehydrogenase
MRLAGKIAIVSGAASGMGAATARMFVREGAKVVLADVLEHEGRQVADAIGASAGFEPLDVTKGESWTAVVAAYHPAFRQAGCPGQQCGHFGQRRTGFL